MAASSESASSDEHGAPTEERNLTLDERVLRGKSEHTCLKRLDELMYCLSEHLRQPPTAQCVACDSTKFACHRHSTDEPVRQVLQRRHLRLLPRTLHCVARVPQDQAQQAGACSGDSTGGAAAPHTPAGTASMRFRLTRASCRAHQEWARTVPRTHLWAFRPEYEAEAYERYGLRPAPPSAHPESQNDAMPSESG